MFSRLAPKFLSFGSKPKHSHFNPSFKCKHPTRKFTEVTKLNSGLQVATETIYGETATIGVFVHTGSSYETSENNGIAHFLEHLAFKGTTKRTQKDLEIEVENMGGSLNAYTTREHTVYLAKVFKSDIEKGVDILSDIIQNSVYEEKSIDYERGVILREMEEVNNNKDEVIFDLLHSIAFEGSSLSYTILGPEKNIRGFKRNDFVKYISNYYTTDRVIVVGAGNVKHDQLAQLSDKYFHRLPANGTAIVPPHIYKGAIQLVPEEHNQNVDAVIAYQGTGWASEDHIPLLVLQSIIGCYDQNIGGGKNLSSRFLEHIAVNRLAEKFNSFNSCYNQTGLFGAYFTTTPENVVELCKAFIFEYVRLAHEADENEVDVAKNRLKSSLLLSLDGTTPICEDIGRQLLTIGRRISPEELFARIDSVDHHIIRDVAMRYLTDVHPSAVAMGQVDNFPSLEQLQSWTSW